MGVFAAGDETPGADWFLFRDGPAHLVHGSAGRDALGAELNALGYHVEVVDASRDLLTLMGDLYQWLGADRPERVSLDGLNDWLTDFALWDLRDDRPAAGSVLVLTSFDHLVERHADTAISIVDIFADAARLGLLLGHRILLVLHVDDWSFTMPATGGRRARFVNWPHHRYTPDSDVLDYRRWVEQVELGQAKWRRLFHAADCD